MASTTASTHSRPELAELPASTVLAIDGEGAPDGPAFVAAVEALYAELGHDRPLQGTWWSGDDRHTFVLDRPQDWRWILAVPTADDAAAPSEHTGVRLERRPAERVARLIHHGSYEDEGPSLAALYAFVAEQGLSPAGAHTETYLTDPRTTPPGDLRTELRVPVR
jgi:hypothetical protein